MSEKAVTAPNRIESDREAAGRAGEREALRSVAEPDEAPQLHFGLMVGESQAMHGVYELIRKLQGIRVTVLIQGESGTGKEFAAQALHRESLPGQRLVAVNCGVFTPELIASELFGHEKGSFTGAVQRRRGYFEQADGGTLFLDEITEMPAELQAQLLRVLETGRFLRVGGETPISANVRVIAATNRDPQEAVKEGLLREDLYYRLSAFPLPIPPLRERLDDIPLLVEHFALELRRKHHVDWSPPEELIGRMQTYHWPGNVRELKHAVHRAFLMRGEKGKRGLEGLCSLRGEAGAHDLLKPGRTIAEMEKMLILNTLRHYSGDKDKTAKALGVCLKTLYNRLNRYRREDTVWH